MLSHKVRILNFDGSLTRQTRLIERYRPEIIDLTSLGGSGRLWSNKKTAAAIGASLQPQAQQDITFLGSGDFHHVSQLLVSRFAGPLTLIVFDFHPDWDILPPSLGCGSWVSRALELKNINKVLLLGISSDDISSPAIHTGNLQALKDDRLEIYPCAHKPTRVLFREVPRNSSLQVRRSGLASEITWTELQGRDMEAFMALVLQRCESKKVYISIDKDCLRSDHALSNWEEGRFSLDELLRLLKVMQETMDIVGLDITGEYSEPAVAGRIKALCSRLDHPACYSACGAPAEKINTINEETNLRILELLLGP
jgi:hypothetical protein